LAGRGGDASPRKIEQEGYGGVPLLPAFVRGLGLELKIKIKDTACGSDIVTCASDSSCIVNAVIEL